MDSRPGLRVEPRENTMQRSWTPKLALRQLRASIRITAGSGKKSFEESSQIETSAAHHDRSSIPAGDSREHRTGANRIVAGGEGLGRVSDIDHMVRNAATVFDASLRGSDVESPIDLHRIAVDDFASEALREMQREIGFSRSGRPEDGDQEMSHRSKASPVATAAHSISPTRS